MGFHCVRSEATFVRFESPRFGINIFHGRHSFEIGLDIESAQESTDAYPIPLILTLVDPKQAESYRYYATHTKEGVTEGVRRLAEDFQRCVDAGILSDGQLFSRLRLQGKELVRNYSLEVELRQVRSASQTAWEKKDFQQIVKILTPLQKHLSSVEIKGAIIKTVK